MHRRLERGGRDRLGEPGDLRIGFVQPAVAALAVHLRDAIQRALQCDALLAHHARDLYQSFTQSPDFIPPRQCTDAGSGGHLCDVSLKFPNPAGYAPRGEEQHGCASPDSEQEAHRQDGIAPGAQLAGAVEICVDCPRVRLLHGFENALHPHPLGFAGVQTLAQGVPPQSVGPEAFCVLENALHAEAFQRLHFGQALPLKNIVVGEIGKDLPSGVEGSQGLSRLPRKWLIGGDEVGVRLRAGLNFAGP